MNAIRPIAQTKETVTLRREDYEAMLGALEDAADIVALVAAEANEKAIGKKAARADHLPAALVARLIADEN